jgi:hypothetical protein
VEAVSEARVLPLDLDADPVVLDGLADLREPTEPVDDEPRDSLVFGLLGEGDRQRLVISWTVAVPRTRARRSPRGSIAGRSALFRTRPTVAPTRACEPQPHQNYIDSK